MMKQYMETKSQYQDCILFYRLGDFYEMFFDDALTASRELEITLTGKNCGQEERAPMCGVPYHAVESYLNKLVSKGYKVAICEQVEDPKTAKGIVKREVVRIVTPGTNLDTQALDESKNNYIMCIVYIADRYGVSVADITTGDYFVTEIEDGAKLMDEIYRFSPSEIICNEAFYMSGMDLDGMKDRLGITIYSLDAWYFDDAVCRQKLLDHFKVSSFAGLGLADYDCGVISAGALLQYLLETQKNDLSNLTHITPYASGKYMMLDSSTRRNLELCETLREKQKRGSLLWVLDKTKTAMGARTLRKYVEQPLIDKKEIEKRLDAVQELKDQAISREELREYLSPVYDLERLIMKITYGSANPRDLTAFRTSLEMLPPIRYILQDMQSELLKKIWQDITEIDNQEISIDTVSEYLTVLDDLYVTENIPPFSADVRSPIRVKQAVKRHFPDPSLPSSLLRLTEEKLIGDLQTFGFLFESMCLRDLLTYADAMKADVYHYQDYRNNEIDAVIEKDDGEWGAFEIRLGANQIDKAAENLLRISRYFQADGFTPPRVLCVICGMSIAAYRRPDGVFVVPITALRD